MGIDEIKTALQSLPTDERRKVALYILELEKEHVQQTYGPKIAEDVDRVTKVFQEAMERLKKFAKKSST